MKTIFLAAGLSSRIAPMKEKNLLKFCGKPILIHILENAQQGGLENFIIVCNQENKKHIANVLQKYNFSADLVVQPQIKEGMAGGILAGLDLVEEQEDVFIHNAQDYFDVSVYKELLDTQKNVDGKILAKKMDHYFPGGYLQVDNKNKIQSIIEKPGEGKEPSDLVNIVAHYFRQSGDLKKALQKTSFDQGDAYEKALQILFSTQNFHAVEYIKEWRAIKYPWHILEMMDLVFANRLQKISKNSQISEKSEIIGPVFIEDGVKIFNNATIIGPCFIGKNTIVGQNTLIRQSNIGQDCEIGFGSEIARSYLEKNISVHNSYVGDSVIGEGVNFGAFSVTTNLRLDKRTIKMKIKNQLIDSKRMKLGCIVGANSQIGSGVKILPGRSIELNTFIPPNKIFK